MPLADSSVALVRFTVAVIPEEQAANVIEPFAQYVKESEVAVPLGTYVNVPFPLSVTVPLAGAVKSWTP